MATSRGINPIRATFGQGLGMGWGDEAEAWLRSKLGKESYQDALSQVRGDYSQYTRDYPVESGVLEFGGGAIPGAALLMVPGGQGAGAAQLARSTTATVGRMGALGAGSGALTGAGTATEGSRGTGAGTGALIGGTLGAAIPMASGAGSVAVKWLRDRLAPSEAYIAGRAAERVNKSLTESGMVPQDIQRIIATDAATGVPSVVANANPALADLAQAVAQRTGKGTRNVEETLYKQRLGSRERTHQQVVKGLSPGDYYSDLDAIKKDMATKAAPYYQAAYQRGEVADPAVLEFLKLPQFQQGLDEAGKLLAAEGREVDMSKPTVEVLDQVKRGLDSLIEKETDTITGKTTSLGRIYTQKKNEFLKALDMAVPEYAQARAVYRGDAELANALRKGKDEFGQMDHEQVIKLVGSMSDAEKQAFRTGVTRDLYSRIMKPSGNFNAAQRLMGAPEMQAKMQPLFENPAQFNLFKAVMEREAQLFQQSNKILGGSSTAKNLYMREGLDEGDSLGGAVAQGLMGNFKGAVIDTLLTNFRKGTIGEKTADKLSQMLMSKDPHDVAAVVRLLEEQAASQGPRAVKAGAVQAGAVTTLPGTLVSPQPTLPEEPMESEVPMDGPDIEADLQTLHGSVAGE